MRDIDARCKDEVIQLHQFFVDWFEGKLSGDESFERFSGVMAEGFEIISPDGQKMNREQILSAVRGGHGLKTEGTFSIYIENYIGRSIIDGLHLATYEEWQRSAGKKRGRLSSALFRRADEAPNGVEWLHVHETWLP